MKINLLGIWLAAVFFFSGIWPHVAFADETPKESHPKIYDESANGERQISDALGLAKSEHKNVLLQFGANWCVWCLKLHAFFDSNKTVSETLENNYIPVLIDLSESHNQDLPSRYAAKNGFGLPFIVILGVDGMYLTTKNTEELEDGDHYSPEKVLAFLMEWTPKSKSQLVHQLVDIFLKRQSSINTNEPSFRTLQAMSADVVPYLIEVIGTNSSSKDDLDKRRNAYVTLGLLHSSGSSAVSFLTTQFNTNNNLLQIDSSTLRDFGREAKEAIPVLTKAFHDADLRMQFEAAWTLTKVEPDYPELIPTMSAWLKSPNVYCRRVAPIALGDLGQLAASIKPALTEALNDEDKTVRQNAAQAIKKIDANTAEQNGQIK